jgi:hypothetical protein
MPFIAIDSLYLNNPSLLFDSRWLPSPARSIKSLLRRVSSRLSF